MLIVWSVCRVVGLFAALVVGLVLLLDDGLVLLLADGLAEGLVEYIC